MNGDAGEGQEASPGCLKEAYLATKTSDKSSRLGTLRILFCVDQTNIVVG